jgi:hypothetical protein
MFSAVRIGIYPSMYISYGASLYSTLISLSNQSGPPRPKQFKFENF